MERDMHENALRHELDVTQERAMERERRAA